MKKQIIITVILLIATAITTVVYFKNLNPPGVRTNRILATIPNDASLIFEFTNDKSFYEVFTGNKLFINLVGSKNLVELDTLKNQLLQDSFLEKYFSGQNIFVSLHPNKENIMELLFTSSINNGVEVRNIFEYFSQPSKLFTTGQFNYGSKKGYSLYINSLKKTFYILLNDENIVSASFSKDLVEQSSNHKTASEKIQFELPDNLQNSNSLANLYVNYNQLTPLFSRLFKNKNEDICETLEQISGLASLSLNYHSDAVLFSGITNYDLKKKPDYLDLFKFQKPIVNQLKDILPSTTAYCTTYSISDPAKFQTDLTNYQTSQGLKKEKDQLFTSIRNKTGTRFKTEFVKLFGYEFALVTTKYFEKFAIVNVKDGSKLKELLTKTCKMYDKTSGQFEQQGIPTFLLGEVFGNFKRPYFTVIDNYLVLANSKNELSSFYDLYLNRKFLIKNDKYKQFDYLLAERCNISFLINFKNTLPVLKRDLLPEVYDIIDKNSLAYDEYYSASCQFSASDKSFYSNFCLKFNPDSAISKPETSTP